MAADGRTSQFSLAALVLVALCSTAIAQTVAWTQQNVSGPSPRYGYAMTYDAARHVTVLFGGNTSAAGLTLNGDTWEWDGSSWSQRTAAGPSPRFAHAMAYDSARHVTVLFGGSTMSAGASGETWEWDGTLWTLRYAWTANSNQSPTPRTQAAMAYDAARGVTLLYGGASHDDTWEWDGTAWTQRVASGPAPLSGHAMAYDTAHSVIVLFGGRDDSGARHRETWEWNGFLWSLRAATGPTARFDSSMAYDTGRDVTVLFAGFDGSICRDTWEWNGAGWTQRLNTGPPGRYWHAMVYDSARSVNVAFGGWPGPPYVWGDTWELRVTCGSADFNHDGDSGTDADIEAFFACLAGACCATCGGADFNGDGDTGTDADIESFFRVLAGGSC